MNSNKCKYVSQVALRVLRGTIKGLCLESEKIKKHMNKLRPKLALPGSNELENKYRLNFQNHHCDKKINGDLIRHHLLAYGLLRDIPYKSVESRCGLYNRPSSATIHKIIKNTLPSWSLSHWTIEEVQAWLGKDESGEPNWRD